MCKAPDKSKITTFLRQCLTSASAKADLSALYSPSDLSVEQVELEDLLSALSVFPVGRLLISDTLRLAEFTEILENKGSFSQFPLSASFKEIYRSTMPKFSRLYFKTSMRFFVPSYSFSMSFIK